MTEHNGAVRIGVRMDSKNKFYWKSYDAQGSSVFVSEDRYNTEREAALAGHDATGLPIGFDAPVEAVTSVPSQVEIQTPTGETVVADVISHEEAVATFGEEAVADAIAQGEAPDAPEAVEVGAETLTDAEPRDGDGLPPADNA